ncbi:MAG: hypothetical protein WC438_02655 [Candidatus Pacearchaeota archaeon]
METRHVRLGYEEGLLAKKQLLSVELNLLQTVKKVRGYKLLRTKEMAVKNKLSVVLSALRSQISTIQSTFPKQETEKEKVKQKEKKTEKIETADIQKELKEIEEKLAKLQ